MAHRLNFGKDGRANFFYYGERPWHGLGTELKNPATAKEALQAARLGYQVDKRSLSVDFGEGNITTLDNYEATVRTDTKEFLGVVGNRYKVVQNTEAFDFFDTLVGEGQAIYHTAGALNKGELIWLMAKLPGHMTIVREDIVEKYLVLVNSHDGSSALKVYFTPIRPVCWNTLSASFKDAKDGVSIRHSGNIKNKVEEARRVLGISIQWYTQFEKLCQELAKVPMTADKADAYYDQLLYGNAPEIIREDSSVLNNRKKDLLYLFEHGKGNDMPGVRHTLWAALNGVSEYHDHYRKIKNEAEDPTNRLKSIWFGAAAQAKEKAFELALQVAGLN